MNQPPLDSIKRGTEILCHTAFWYGLLFAAPVFVAMNNQQNLFISGSKLAAGLLVLMLLMTAVTSSLAVLLGAPWRRVLAMILVATALVLAIQSNVLHSITDFGQFDGTIVNFRKYGWLFWLEWYGFLVALALLAWLLYRVRRISVWVPLIPILSFTLLLVPNSLSTSHSPNGYASNIFDESVFDFSSVLNLVHLLPDSLQSDVAQQVLEENPELADRFRGFTFYTNHLGMYYGTVPAVPTLLTGKPFRFDLGLRYSWIIPFIDQNSYQNELANQGFELDLVPIERAHCVSRARSCVPRPFLDWKSRGYRTIPNEGQLYSLRLLADLSLYRLLPSFLKEKIYNKGEWWLSDSTMDGASRWPDPVVREWTEHMNVTAQTAIYKWYHYIGTHKPLFWNKDCDRQSGLARSREIFLGQAYCILKGVAMLLDKLQEEGIYDQTAIIISSDHGHNVIPRDIAGSPDSVPLTGRMMGTARPALLVKSLDSRAPLKFSNSPTSLSDIAAITLSSVGVTSEKFPNSTLELPVKPDRDRYFYDYSVEKLSRWNDQPVPYDLYRVNGPVTDDRSWSLQNIYADRPAPQQFPLISHRTSSEFLRGVFLNPNDPDRELAWIIRKQFAFLIYIPENFPATGQLVVTFHVPEWVGKQTFKVRINDFDLPGGFEIQPESQFWQEVRINLPTQSRQPGNNLISIQFNKLVHSPRVENLAAAALLKSIGTEPGGSL